MEGLCRSLVGEEWWRCGWCRSVGVEVGLSDTVGGSRIVPTHTWRGGRGVTQIRKVWTGNILSEVGSHDSKLHVCFSILINELSTVVFVVYDSLRFSF